MPLPRSKIPAPTLDYARTLFTETQGIRMWWIWAIVVAGPLVPLAFILHGVFTGRAPIAAGLIGGFACGLPLLLTALIRLRVTVSSERICVRLFPFRKTLPIHELASAHATTYKFREFLGWGLRYSMHDSTTAYTMSGYEGVRIETRNGHKFLIGSSRPRELCDAIHTAIAWQSDAS